MPLFTDASQQFRQMDRFSCGNTGIHRLDARIKIGAFLVYQICVLSWPPQEITGLLPFFLFPVCVIRLAGLPLGYLLKRTLWLLPVAVMIGLFNPLVDRTPMGEWFGIPVTQGMISFISIILRCMLTILGAFTLLASTGFAPLCRGLRQLGAPRILITLMTFLYRYAFILVDECQHMLMAFRSRQGGSGPIPLSTWGAMAGQLLLRTFGRAERIYQAVLCRGGEDPEIRQFPQRHHWPWRSGRPSFLYSRHSVPLFQHHHARGPVRPQPHPMSHHLVETIDLCFSYPDSPPALNGVSLRITHGESVAVVGGNGAGKSTLLLHLNGLLTPSSGQVRVGDIPVTPKTVARVRESVGMVFQQAEDQLFMPTVREDVAFGPLNMGLPPEEIRRRVEQALRNVHAEALADKMTHHLSGGEKRAVSIATVLSMSPDILVLDEPSANLDPASRRTLISLLRQFTHTKIIATHDLDMVMDLCTRCIVMKDGSILADAPVPDIFADRSLLEEARLEQPLSYLLMRQERQRNNSGAS